MPKKAESGETTADLLAYLFGPGNHEEHIDPHLVAAWTPGLPCPARNPDRMTLSDLALLLDAPVEALRGPKPAEHVWHISVRNDPTDRTLSDAEWATVAAEMVHAAGIAPHGDTHACRWVAVRHADDHIHIVATLARQDGRHPRIRGDIPRMHTAARAFEAAWGLAPMSPLDRTARRAPVTGEREKAARRGLQRQLATVSSAPSARPPPAPPAPPTSSPGCATQGSACASTTTRPAPWTGTRSRCPATAPTTARARSGSPGGPSPTTSPCPGSANASPAHRPRRHHPRTHPHPPGRDPPRPRRPHRRRRRRRRPRRPPGGVAATSPTVVRDQVRAAAAAFEQASRAPGTRTLHGTARAHFKAAARALDHAPRAARGGGAPAVLTLLIALVEAIEAATAWHRAQQHHAQARAAAQAAALLREAATLTSTPPRASHASRTAPNTVRVTPAAERGPAPATPVTRVPPRPHAGPHPASGPGPAPGPGRSR
ncbi:mobilization protein [Streptomyces sp. JV180]|uniref:mobilization protein n=1 Tax=Streptomyces sp. JV180 TaxID=858634 RepID=UPI00168BF5CC|nr:mobilization protein [Streptomyces sp. JV180]MBD3543859.1 mobilization protein [Streptomyces sp. JV180]